MISPPVKVSHFPLGRRVGESLNQCATSGEEKKNPVFVPEIDPRSLSSRSSLY
jgi:hypothetical protein